MRAEVAPRARSVAPAAFDLRPPEKAGQPSVADGERAGWCET
jgi:hypothetical protein